MAKTKDVMVNKFRVKHNGTYFGPGQPDGQIIYGLPEKMADDLIAGSNGKIVEIPKREEVEENIQAAKAKSGKKGKVVDEDDDSEGGDGLPKVDPRSTVV